MLLESKVTTRGFAPINQTCENDAMAGPGQSRSLHSAHDWARPCDRCSAAGWQPPGSRRSVQTGRAGSRRETTESISFNLFFKRKRIHIIGIKL